MRDFLRILTINSYVAVSLNRSSLGRHLPIEIGDGGTIWKLSPLKYGAILFTITAGMSLPAEPNVTGTYWKRGSASYAVVRITNAGIRYNHSKVRTVRKDPVGGLRSNPLRLSEALLDIVHFLKTLNATRNVINVITELFIELEKIIISRFGD